MRIKVPDDTETEATSSHEALLKKTNSTPWESLITTKAIDQTRLQIEGVVANSALRGRNMETYTK